MTYRLRDESMKTAGVTIINHDNIRKEIKKLEQEVEVKLSSYSNFSERVEQWNEEADGATFAGDEISDELDLLLQKLAELNRALDEGSTSSSIIQHHKTHLDDYAREHRNLKNKVKSALERAQLVGTRRANTANKEATVNIDHLFQERAGVHNSSTMAYDILGQAHATNERLDDQFRRLTASSYKLRTLTSQFAGISALMGQIKWKKYKNSIIVWSVVAICMCFLLWWWLRSHS